MHTIKVRAMADTGCQSCLIGLNLVKQLGIQRENLIPVSMRMHAANNNRIAILGAVFLRLTRKDSHGESVETRQLIYVTNNTDKLFISREACIKPGLIPSSFLIVMGPVLLTLALISHCQ